MLQAYVQPEDEPVPPQCRATVDLIQQVLDGEAGAALDADPHPVACAACRARVRAARVLLDVLAAPGEPVAVPAGFADRVVKEMYAERHARTRRKSYTYALGALAASLLLVAGAMVVMYFVMPKEQGSKDEFVKPPAPPVEVAPPPREKPPAPPVRIGDEFAKAGQAFRDAPKPITDSVAAAPKLFDALAGTFKLPAPPPDPMANVELPNLPVAARAGLEPVTGTAEKAFNRFLRDVGAVKPNS